MALIDVQALFSDKQVVTTTAVSTNSYDTTAIRRNIGRAGQRVRFVTDTAVTAAGAATVTFEVIQADDAALTTNVTVLASSGPVAKTALGLGTSGFDVSLPDTTQRYVGARYTVATGPLTAGSFTAAIVGEGGSGHQRQYGTGYPSPFVG